MICKTRVLLTACAVASLFAVPMVSRASATQAGDPARQAPAPGSQKSEPSAHAPKNLRVEYKTDPVGIDAPAPRFSWELDDARRGALQTGYRVLVSENRDLLAQEKGDQWDSGQMPLPDTNQVAFAGHPLAPWHTYSWVVRTWDGDGQPSPWSAPASFTVGPLLESDWRAEWITPAVPHVEAPEGVRLGYHSDWAAKDDDFKYVQIDFGQPRIFDNMIIHPARAAAGEKGVLFPLRFKIYVDDSPRFDQKFLKIGEYTWQDVPDAGNEPMTFPFSRYKFRYVRIVVEKMQKDDDKGYAFALGEIELREVDHNIAPEGVASASDSLEKDGWSVKALNDGELVPKQGAQKELQPAALIRKDFKLDAKPKRALLAASALGVYEVTINRVPVGNERLAPGWTDYTQRVPYQMLDVTPLLRAGDNAVGIQLADGWYAGRVGVVEGTPDAQKRGRYGDAPQVRLELSIDDGARTVVLGTDTTWKWTRAGTVRSADLIDGESFNAGTEPRDWDYPGYYADEWRAVQLAAHKPAVFAQIVEPARERDEIHAVAVNEPVAGHFVYDFGQNIAGVVRLHIPTQEYPELILRHAEMLDAATGLLWTANLRTAAQTDKVVLRPGMQPNWNPRFTIHGFRYVEISGVKKAPELEEVGAVPITSDVRETASFECSDPLLTRLWKNIVWTRRNDFLGLPIDAPARDTRVGELGAVLPFVPTALLQADLASLFTQWLGDVRAAQDADGRFPDFAPYPSAAGISSGTPGWADAGVFVPWEMYLACHDQRLLAASWPSMLRWIDYVHGKNPGLVWKDARGADLGDRFNGNTVRADGWQAKGGEVPKDVFATAFFARSCALAAKAAYALQKGGDADRLDHLAADARKAFRQAFVEPNGRIAGDTQAGYALAVDFDLLADDEKLEDLAVAQLVRKIEEAHGALTTGMHTTHHALLALSRHGHHDLALKIAQRHEAPSWGNQIDNGATTTWERWDGYLPKRGFQDPDRNSFDSVAFGSIGEWMFRTIGGIDAEDEHVSSGPVRLLPILNGPTRSSAEGPRAFEHVNLRPMPAGNITWAKAEHTSIAGRVALSWRIDSGSMVCDCTIPANTTATLEMPAKDKDSVNEGDEPVAQVKGLDVRRFENGHALIDVPAGTYRFTSKLQ